MGDELEALCANNTTLEADLRKRLNQDLDKVKADLDACVECWDEAFLHIGTSGRHVRTTVLPQCSVIRPAVQTPLGQDPIPLYDMDELVIPDQVFEAYTDEPEADTSEWGTCELLSVEEKEKKKEEKKEAVRLLKELKTVIAVRAADWEQREERARQRQRPASGGGSAADSCRHGGGDIGDGGDSPGTVRVGYQHASSRLSEERWDRDDQRALARQDCLHTCRQDSEENNSEELVEDLHEDLVNLTPQQATTVYEMIGDDDDDDDDDIFGESGDFSADEEDDPDRVDPRDGGGVGGGDEAAVAARLAVLREKLAREPGAGVGFSASAVAEMAARRSQTFGQLGDAQTFGDDDDYDDDDDDSEDDDDDEGVIES